MPRPKKTDAQSPEPEATQTTPPRISVIDRRLKNPFGTPSREIPLRGEKQGWVVRTFCADPEHPNRHFDAVHRLGWTPLERADLAVSPESIGYVVAADGRIVRGQNGNEVLMGMPKAYYDQVQMAKAAANTASLNPSKLRSEVAQATAEEHGDEAGDTTYKHYSQQDIVEPIGAE